MQYGFWGDVGVNLSSDFLFVLIIGVIFCVLWAVWFLSSIKKAQDFFGSKENRRWVVYTSVHQDPTTNTREVYTVLEIQATFEFMFRFKQQFTRSNFGKVVKALGGLIGQELVNIPDPIFGEFSSCDNIENRLIIGGPLRNLAARELAANNQTWIKFDDQIKQFVISKGRRTGERLNNSGRLAVIEKVITNNQVNILAYGFGETHTKSAVEYLGNNWERLHDRFGKNEFAICFPFDAPSEIIELSA